MTQLTFSSNFHRKICFKFCILKQIIATVLFICISCINNKRSLLRFQSTKQRPPLTEGGLPVYKSLYFEINVTQQCRCSPVFIFRAWATCGIAKAAKKKMKKIGSKKLIKSPKNCLESFVKQTVGTVYLT